MPEFLRVCSLAINIWETIPDRARTIDNYNANPNGYRELSFSKGEILENANDNGKWWLLARNQNGETGLVQINYTDKRFKFL
ncbi:hypothetical protein C1646_768881 [Rhizophagus diaphanus]|nr:hypothetical protein C1646_768881 [Rhizophagus diaphanus] [Rhizophagus sp. MUCL 43196]